MSEDWRLRVDLHEDGAAHALTEHLGESALEHDLDTSFHDLVVVSREGAGVFCYTGTRRQAERAEILVHAVAANLGWHVDAALARWHPAAEAWKDPEKPLGQSDQERAAAESAAAMAEERGAAGRRVRPGLKVGMECRSDREALQFAAKLRGEGLPSVRRHRYLLVGAFDEDSGDALAERLRREGPPGSIVVTEAAMRASAARAGSPFSVLVA